MNLDRSKNFTGLTAHEVIQSRLKNGSNHLTEVKGKNLWQIIKEGLEDRTLIILMIAAIIILIIAYFGDGKYVDGISILFAVFVAVFITSYNHWRSQVQFKSLQIEKESFKVRVIRECIPQEISAYELVVGDIVEFEAGHKLPTDGVLLSGIDVQIDESTLTGESLPISKNVSQDSQLRAGTLVADGRGTMEVTLVGDKTEYGKLRSELSATVDPTPLQERLSHLANRVGFWALMSAALIFLSLLLSSLFKRELGFDLTSLKLLFDYLILGTTIVVVAVPEGLPVAVTICLAYGLRKMSRDKNLVRKLMACETMGAVDFLCIDKTGTLTVNEMNVEKFWHASLQKESITSINELPLEIKNLIFEIIALNSTAHLQEEKGKEICIGSPTEVALLKLLKKNQINYLEKRQGSTILSAASFSSERKCMSTVVETKNGTQLLVKGAPEILIEYCTHIIDSSGRRPITQVDYEYLKSIQQEWATSAYRPLAFAYKELREKFLSAKEEEFELTLVSVVAIGNPIRKEAQTAVEICKNAGIQLCVVSGDSKIAAEAVATKVGILQEKDICLSGEEFRNLNESDLTSKIPFLKLVYRASPLDKLKLVQFLKSHGKIVAVTGDGTNDAPALRHADVGLSMGRSGTEVAREASDIVILDDNLISIVKSVFWGRAIYENIRKFLQFQLTVSFVALLLSFVSGMLGTGAPLSVVQLLWVNLIMDTLAALALSTQPPSYDLLNGPPHNKKTPLITKIMGFHILSVSILMISVLLVVLYTDIFISKDHPAKLTFIFNVFVLMQLGNLINCRSTTLKQNVFQGILKSPFFLLIFILIFILQVMIIQWGGSFFHTTPLDKNLWIVSLLLGACIPVWGFLMRGLAKSSLFKSSTDSKTLRPILFKADFSQAILKSLSPIWILVGIFLVILGIILRIVNTDLSFLSFLLFVLGFSFICYYFWSHQKSKSQLVVKIIKRHAYFSVVLMAVIVILLNYIGSRHYRRFDVTQLKKFELSEQTVQVLDQLKYPVKIISVFRENIISSDIRDLLNEYAARGKFVQVQHIDPDKDPGEVERIAARAGLKNPRLSSIILEYQNHFRVIALSELIRIPTAIVNGRKIRLPEELTEFRGEEAITSGLVAISQSEQLKICFAFGNGERSMDDFGPEGLALARDKLRREGFVVEIIDLSQATTLDKSCHALIQAGPQTIISDQTRGAIDQYLKSGGKWLLLVEPWQTGGLEPLLTEWGIGIRPLYVVDPSGSAAGVGPSTVVTYAYQSHQIVMSLTGVPTVFPYATSVFFLKENEKYDGRNIVLTTPRGFGETDRVSREPAYTDGVDRKGPVSLATAVEEPTNFYSADGRKEPARIVVVGDTDFATNSHLHRMGNADFFLNIMDWLTKRESLIAIRSRSPDIRRVALTSENRSLLYWSSLGLLPCLIGIFGGLVAWRRRT